MQSSEQIKSILAGFFGTQAYHYTAVSRRAGVFYTDGVRALLQMCEAYWLLDLICYYQLECRKDEALHYIQFWTLRVNTNEETAVLSCERDAGEVVIQHRIAYTDFPLDEIKIWLEIGVVDDTLALVAMLPGER